MRQIPDSRSQILSAHRVMLFTVSMLASLLAGQAAAQTPDGRALAANCFQCHGTDGRAVRGMPSLAGKDGLGEKMIEYKYKPNLQDVMVLQARAYTTEQLLAMGEYFASVPEHEPTARPAASEQSGPASDRQSDVAGEEE